MSLYLYQEISFQIHISYLQSKHIQEKFKRGVGLELTNEEVFV